MSEPKPKPCPECGSDDIDVDSAQGGSWAQCRECEFKVQYACSESAVVARWNKLSRNKQYCSECGQPDCNGQCFGDDMMGD